MLTISSLSFILVVSLSIIMAFPATALKVIDLVSNSPSIPTKISVLTCSGLLNRNLKTEGVYVLLTQPQDSDWLKDIDGITNPKLTSIPEFLTYCLNSPLVKGYISYNYSTHQASVPNMITLASVLDAVPLELNSPFIDQTTLVFDVSTEWKDYTDYNSTEYMYNNYIDRTTALSIMNPGYDVHGGPARDPPLTQSPNPALTDFIVKERLFNFFLNDACIRGTDDYALTKKITSTVKFPKPIPVYGYNDAWPIAGDIFEAETNCNREHDMGQIASDGLSNLAYFSRKEAITSPVPQNPSPSIKYKSINTYVSIIIGDGDNLNFLKGTRKDWFRDRLSRCAAASSSLPSTETTNCFPLSWSISPQTLHVAPDWFMWYYNNSYTTKNDYFVLPPSGDLYSYPSEFSSKNQDNFVASTEKDGLLMSLSGSVHWEWFGHWNKTVKDYFPRYSANKVIQGFFAVNVPFDLPVAELFGPRDDVLKVADNVVVFKPREWRGTVKQKIPFSRRESLTPTEMAEWLNKQERGSITAIYVTSDGGGNLDMVYDMVAALDAHVQVVGTESLIDIALQREA